MLFRSTTTLKLNNPLLKEIYIEFTERVEINLNIAEQGANYEKNY